MEPKDRLTDGSANTANADLVIEDIGLPPVLLILGKISQGGIGAVFRAEHAESHAQLAVKVLLPHLAAIERHRLRFIQEAETMRSLADPHIVTVHDCGVSKTGLPYMTMDYLEGRTLEQVLAQRSVTIAEALEIFIQTSEAVAHAHKKGIIHRDLKPSNIMLCDGHDQLFVKVLDFGIAKVTEEANIEAARNLTATGELLGTPSYMSPEQSLGFTLDKRSDIYSLGCLMYHTLTGTPPFTAATALQLLAKHTNNPAPQLAKLRPDLKLPHGLDRIVEKTLEKRRDDRYSDVEELLIDLHKVKAGTTLPVRLTGNQKQYLQIALNIVIWFSVFYVAGSLLPGAISYLQHNIGGHARQETPP